MKMKFFLGLFAIATVLMSCGENTEVEVGKKTTMAVNEVFDAGRVILGEKVDAVFTVENTGDYPLVISEVKGGCTCTVVEKPEKPILPGDSFEIRAYVNTDRVGVGSMNKPVTITANTAPSNNTVSIKALVVKK